MPRLAPATSRRLGFTLNNTTGTHPCQGNRSSGATGRVHAAAHPGGLHQAGHTPTPHNEAPLQHQHQGTGTVATSNIGGRVEQRTGVRPGVERNVHQRVLPHVFCRASGERQQIDAPPRDAVGRKALQPEGACVLT